MLFTPARRNYGFDLFDDFFDDPQYGEHGKKAGEYADADRCQG